MPNNTVPMLVADTMTREGLSEADTVWDTDANSVAVSLTVLGYSVRNRAGRFDFIESDGTLHPRGYKTRGPVTSWARKRMAEAAPAAPVAEAAPVDVVPDPVADAQDAQDAKDAEAFRIKATKAHDRVVKGHKRVMAAHERAHAAQTRAEAAQERAEAAEAAESERAYVRVAEADALMWTHTPGAAEYRHAFGAFVSARFDAEFLPVAEACAEVYAYAEAAEAAAGAEYENGDGKDVPGADQCAEDADHARKETMIEYGVFEPSAWSGKWSASRFDAETACDLICGHARDMAAAVRHAEAAAEAAEAAAEQAEAWADAAEDQTETAEYETDALFTLGADGAQRALSRAYWGVSDAVAESVVEAAESAECAPSTVGVTVAAPVAPVSDVTDVAVPVAPVDDAAADVAENAETAPVDPGYSLDVASGERVWSRPGFDRSYAGRAEVLRGHVSVADARAAVARFPECVKITGGAPGVGMGCAHLHADVTRTGEDTYTWGGADGTEMIRTGDPYEVTFPDGTTVRGTWVECGARFAEWAITERPEWVCAWAEGYADGYATLARIRADIAAEREADARAMAEAEAEAATARTDLNRVSAVWERVVDGLSVEDAEKVWDVAADGRRGLVEAERSQGAGNRWGVADGAARARAAVAWLTESARRCGLEIPEAERTADAVTVPDAAEAAECGSPSDAAPVAVPDVAERPAAEMGTCTAPAVDVTPVRPDVVSDPGTVDAWEGEGGAMLSGAHSVAGPVGRPGPYGGRLVTKAEAAARARAKGDALRPEAEARAFVARERLAWLTDMRDLAREACNWGVVGVSPETARAWYSHAQEVAKVAADAADAAATGVERYEWEAQRYEDDAKRCAQDVARARSALARMTAGDVPASHGVWLSVDGGAAVSFVMPSDEQYAPGAEGDRLFVGMLADAVAARDEGRALTSKDVPSKQKTGHGPGADFKSAVVRAGQPLVKPWKAPRIPSEGKPLTDDVLSGFADAEYVVAETEAAPGVWLPMAAVRVADLAGGNGWTVAMERREGGSVVIVRTAGVIERKSRDGKTATVAGECVAVFERGEYVQERSGALVGGRYMGGATLSQVLTTVGQTAEPGQLASVTVTPDSAPAPAGVSDPGGEDAWETDGGACIGVDRPGTPDVGRGAVPAGIDPSPEMGTCTAPAVDTTPVHPDVVSDPAAVDTWDGEGGAVPGVEAPRVRSVKEQDADAPYAVRPAVPDWAPVPGTNRLTTELTCAGVQYRILHAPDAVLPYTVQRTLGGADIDLGGWVGLDDVRAIVRADRRRMAALEAERRRVEQQQRRAAYRLLGQRRQAPVRLTEEDRRAIARRAETRHRPVAAELYVSPITGNAVLAWVCGTCATTHDDPLWRPQTIGGSYRTALSVERDTLAALVEKHGWTVTSSWTAHGTRGDTMRARIAPTPAYLAWVDATYGPDPATPEVEAGEHIAPIQRGWWEVISKEGHRYELTCRQTLTGPVWSVRHRSNDGFETVATTGMAGTVLIGMRVHSAERDHESSNEGHPESVHDVPLAS